MSIYVPELWGGNRPVVSTPEIQSRYRVVARELPADIAQQIHAGEGSRDDITHGYVPGNRLTRRVSRYNALSHTNTVLNIPELDGEFPWMTSVSTDPAIALSRVEFDHAFEATAGERIRKLRYHVDSGTEPGLVTAAMIDVYTSGLPGEVEGAEEVDGSMIGIAVFPSIEAARRFNNPAFGGRPSWLGDNITGDFSTGKLVEELSYGDRGSEAFTAIKQSANKRGTHLRSRAIGLRVVKTN